MNYTPDLPMKYHHMKIYDAVRFGYVKPIDAVKRLVYRVIGGKLAGQVNASIYGEIKANMLLDKMGKETQQLGDMDITGGQ